MAGLLALLGIYVVLFIILVGPRSRRRSHGTSFAHSTNIVFVDTTPGADWSLGVDHQAAEAEVVETTMEAEIDDAGSSFEWGSDEDSFDSDD